MLVLTEQGKGSGSKPLTMEDAARVLSDFDLNEDGRLELDEVPARAAACAALAPPRARRSRRRVRCACAVACAAAWSRAQPRGRARRRVQLPRGRGPCVRARADAA
jgi:hypothetical protein